METIFRIKSSELTPDLLKKIKALFKSEETLEISISPVSDFGLTKKETRKEYINRINKAIKNLETNKDIVSISKKKFNALTDDLLNNK